MKSLPSWASWQQSMWMIGVIARREVRDAFRDWRIVVPIFLLTLAFPALMNLTASRLVGFAEAYGAEIVATQLIPFLLLIVGFFPMSFSLVIALETFVGEKERNSLEPLLATPLSNTQLYAGKMLAALTPPLLASYSGMLVYMVSLWFSQDWRPDWELVAQILLLTAVQGVIMVAGAVIISSQATSVRAANLLASFVIVPMALLIQFEAGTLFWGSYAGLWWVLAGLTITAVILVRMGIFLFNREELLGRDIDQIRLGWMWATFWHRFVARRGPGNGLIAWYRETLAIFRQLGLPMAALLVAFVGAIGLGVWLANEYLFPAELQAELTGEKMLANLEQYAFVLVLLPTAVIWQNSRAIFLQAMLGLFTFGVLGVLVFMLPWVVVTFFAVQFALAGQSAWQFILATVLPHALLEFPALLLISAAALRWQISIIQPSPQRAVSETFLLHLADFARIFWGIGLPLLLAAAFVEALLTPLVLRAVYG